MGNNDQIQHYSITPVLQYSITSLLHYSDTPTPHPVRFGLWEKDWRLKLGIGNWKLDYGGEYINWSFQISDFPKGMPFSKRLLGAAQISNIKLHYSNTPSLQYSSTPSLQYSNTPFR
ncbi:hypothetical protein KJ656_13780 [bacterium]|nr:hypothetical protein [bacterium]